MSSVISASSFHHQLLRCFQNNVPNRILIALSGGVDSMCLAYLLAQYKKQMHPQMLISAVTIDHGFRKESAVEAENVGNIVRKWGIAHSVKKLHYSKDVHSISNFEEVARNLRYDIFQRTCIEQGINALFVAHNKDDQLETFLQRLQMNSTMFGLLGLREKAQLPLSDSSPNELEKIHVYRPLLQFHKSDIRKTCEENSVPWFEDLSNQDISLTQRNLLRYMINEYIPNAVTMRPELRCLTRDTLSQTIQEIEQLVQNYETEKSALQLASNSWGFHFDEAKVEIKFTIPLSEINKIKTPVMARWLYELVYPLSSSKHFHWSYAKLERQAMPRLWAWLETPGDPLIMTYLNVNFNVKLMGSEVHFHLSRQRPQREVASGYSISAFAGDSSWHIFDRIWWFKFEHLTKNIEIRYYNPSMRQQLVADFPEVGNEPRFVDREIGIVPIVLDVSNGQIIAVPTLGLAKDVYVHSKLKSKF